MHSGELSHDDFYILAIVYGAPGSVSLRAFARMN